MFFTYILLIGIKLCATQSIFINPGNPGFNEKVRGYVGSTFRHEIKYFKHEEATADRKELKLLTLDEQELFENTWIKLDVGEKVVYGFPLRGNEGTSTFLVKSITYTPQGEKKTRIKVNIFVKETTEEHNHEIKLCTTLTLDLFLKNVDIRYELAEMLSFYLLKTTPDNFILKKYDDGCIFFSFKNVESAESCSFEKIDLLRRQLFINGRISADFSRSIEHVTTVKSVNLTLNGPCIKPTTTQRKHDLYWVKTVAPILILLAIVGIPVSISCYVCRGVRRRQNKMRQQQDKLAREDQIRLNEQMQEYREACGFDDAVESDSSDSQNQVKWKKDEKEEKQIFLARLFEQYMPQSIQDKFDIGKSVFDYTKQKSSQAKVFKKPLNPVSRILDIRSTTVLQAQARAADPIYTKTRFNTTANGGISTSSALATSNLNLMKKLGCNGSLLSISHKNKEVDPRLDSWRRLNSAMTINNSKTGGNVENEMLNKRALKGTMAPTEEFGRTSAYRNNGLTGSRDKMMTSCNDMYSQHTTKSNLKEQSRGKSVSFFDVSEKNMKANKRSFRQMKDDRHVTSLSCNNISEFAESNNAIRMRFPRKASRSIQTQTPNTNVIGSMKILATTSKQKLKSSIRNGKILGMQTKDCATSPPPSSYRPLKRLANKYNGIQKTQQNIPLLQNELINNNTVYYSSPRDTFIPGERLPSYNSLYPVQNSFTGNHISGNERRILPSTDVDMNYHPNILIDEIEHQDFVQQFHESDNQFFENGEFFESPNDYLDHAEDDRQRNIYYDNQIPNESSYEYFGLENNSFDSSVNQSSIDRSSSLISDSTLPLTANELTRIALRRRLFQQQLPQMYNSFEVFPEMCSLSPNSESLQRKFNTLPTFSHDSNHVVESENILPQDGNNRDFVKSSHSLPVMPPKKERWKSFESGSSEVTYVDFGSEYEIKHFRGGPNETFSFDLSSCSTTPKACQSPIYFRAGLYNGR